MRQDPDRRSFLSYSGEGARARSMQNQSNAVNQLGSILAAFLLQSVVTYGVFADLRGRPVGFTGALAGLKRFFPALGTGLLVLLFMGVLLFAAMFLSLAFQSLLMADPLLLGALVGVIVIQCTFFVAVQATIVEKTSPLKSMSRSSWLTASARWPIFGLLLLIYGTGFALTMLVSGVLLGEAESWSAVRTGLLVAFGINVVVATFHAVCAAVVYHDLRRAKEGVDVADLVQVFE